MTAREVAKFLIEGDEEDRDAKVFADRLMLRIYSAPSLLSYLRDIAMIKQDDEGEQGYKFQVKFSKLPEEVISQVKDLIAVPGVKAVQFDEEYKGCTGFEFYLTDKQLKASRSENQKPKNGPGLNTQSARFGSTGNQRPAQG